MAGLKKFQLGGLDLKSNDLVRDPLKSSGLRNVIKTQKGDIDKMPGNESTETISGEMEKELYHKSYDASIVVKSDGILYKLYNGARQACSIALLETNIGLSVKNRIISAEYLSNLYITTTDGTKPVIKFDGSNAYLAGVPAPAKVFAGTASTISSAGSGYYYRFFYAFKDLNGNITFGPYKQMTSTINNAQITASTFMTANPYGAFFNKYLRVTNATTAVSAASPTLPYSSTNYEVGDKFLFDKDCGKVLFSTVAAPATESNVRFLAVTITAIGGGNITFSTTDLGNNIVTVTSTGTFNIDSRLRMHCFISQNESFGYKSACFSILGTTIPDNYMDNDQNNETMTFTPDINEYLFEDLYNEEQQKLRPPLCKYLAAYGNQLIYGNIIGVWDQNDAFTQYNNDDIIIPSDFGIADNGENHSANIQKIGESYDGSINGISRCNDLLAVVKDNSLFALDGIIEPGGYSLRKIPTNYIGCTSHNSIIQVEGGILFHGNDGIYFSDGVSCKKMSGEIDPFFSSILPARSLATINSTSEKFVFYVTDGTNHYNVVFDYEFKQWFIWETIDMSKGLYQKNDGTLRFAKSTKLYKFNTGYNSDGVAVTGYYATNWEDLREPTLHKKFKAIYIWNLTSTSTTFTLRVQTDWTDTDDHTVTVTIPANSCVRKSFNQKNVMSIRFIFQNSTISQNMLITGYEIEYEATQLIEKGK